MKSVICINPKNYKLTNGNVYHVIEEDDQRYTMFNDAGSKVKYHKNLFDPMELVEVPVAEAPVVPVRLSLEEMLQKVSIHIGTADSFENVNEILNVKIKLTNEMNEEFEKSIFLPAAQSQNSCGIWTIEGLTNLNDQIASLFQENFEDDYPRLVREVFRKFFEELKAIFHEYSAMVTTSLTDTGYIGIREVEDYYVEFNDLTTDYIHNPNSGNMIRQHILYI